MKRRWTKKRGQFRRLREREAVRRAFARVGIQPRPPRRMGAWHRIRWIYQQLQPGAKVLDYDGEQLRGEPVYTPDGELLGFVEEAVITSMADLGSRGFSVGYAVRLAPPPQKVNIEGNVKL